MSLLVTGAGGQLGREWTRYLKEKEVPFTAYTSSGLDIRDEASVRQVLDREKPQVIVNCAAWTDVDGAETHREEAMAVNADGVGLLARWCSRNGATLIHYSTDYVFPGAQQDRERYPAGYPEDAPTGPINVYGQSKLAGERALAESGANYLLIRTAWLCGRYGANFVSTMLRLGGTRPQVQVVNDQYGSPSFTEAVVRQTDQLLKQNRLGIFHVASGGIISWYDFAVEIFRMAGLQVDVQPVSSDRFPTPARRPSFSGLDTSRTAEVPGMAIEEWRTGLKNLLNQLSIRPDED